MNIPQPIRLFDTLIHPVWFTDVLNYIHSALKRKQKAIIFPMNVHILVELSKNPKIKRLFERSAVIIFSDGVPLVWLSKLLGKPLPQRVSGTDLVETLLQTYKRIFLLGSSADVLVAMQKKYTSICGVYSPPYKNSWSGAENAAIIRLINETKPQILLVGVGPLKQELWIVNHFRQTHATIAIAVGSAFDILSGKVRRAPKWVRNNGMEWLWRLALEPRRLPLRYFSDLLYFLYIVFRRKKKDV